MKEFHKSIAAEVVLYINNASWDKISIDDLVKVSGYSRYHLMRIMTEYLGMPLGQYIIKSRVEKAKRLLTETSYSMTRISLDLGYTSPQNFSRVFSNATGISPMKYRRLNNA